MDSFSKCVFVRAGKHTSVHDVHPIDMSGSVLCTGCAYVTIVPILEQHITIRVAWASCCCSDSSCTCSTAID